MASTSQKLDLSAFLNANATGSNENVGEIEIFYGDVCSFCGQRREKNQFVDKTNATVSKDFVDDEMIVKCIYCDNDPSKTIPLKDESYDFLYTFHAHLQEATQPNFEQTLIATTSSGISDSSSSDSTSTDPSSSSNDSTSSSTNDSTPSTTNDSTLTNSTPNDSTSSTTNDSTPSPTNDSTLTNSTLTNSTPSPTDDSTLTNSSNTTETLKQQKLQQFRRSLILTSILQGKGIAFYRVTNIENLKCEAFPCNPSSLKGGEFVLVKFVNTKIANLVKQEGWHRIVFEYWEPEIAAMNVQMLLNTNILTPLDHKSRRHPTFYALGGPHYMMGAFSVFYSMVIHWLTRKSALTCPKNFRRYTRKLEASNLSIAAWRQMSSDWTGIFKSAAAKPLSVLCMWHNVERAHGNEKGCLGTTTKQCPYFHKDLNLTARLSKVPLPKK